MPSLNSTCDQIQLFSGGGPPDAGAYVEIAGTQLIPSPFVNLTVEKYRVGEKIIGGVLKLTLNGNIVANSFNDIIDGSGGGTNIKKILELSQIKNCVCVKIQCSSTLINGFGRIVSASINEGNQPTWVNIAPYTIEIELPSNTILDDDRIVIPDMEDGDTDYNYVLRNVSENLSWSINDDTFNWGSPCSGSNPQGIDGFGNRHIKLNFSVSAAGVEGYTGCNCSGNPGDKLYGLEAAEKYLKNKLTDLRSFGANSLFDISNYDDPPDDEILGAFSSYFTSDKSFLDLRTIEINPIDNSINISGEIIYRPSGCLNPEVFTSLNIEHNLNSNEENIIINGNIIGLIDNNFDEIIQLNSNNFNDCAFRTKIDNAELFLKQIYNPNELMMIADCYARRDPYPNGYIEDDCPYSSGSGSCEITPTPPIDVCDMRITNSQITRNISNGEINFSFTLSNAPNCEVAGVTKIDVNITHDKPHDNIVEIIIPGRGSKGPLIQNLCCNSSEKYDINIDALLNRKTCTADIKKSIIDQLRACAERELQKLVDQDGIDVSCWFKVNDVENIGNSSYKLTRSYVKPSCP